jgi:hypothetical protein
MTKTILTASAALLISAGAAFAGIGDYAPANTPSVDQTTTASIPNVQKHNVSGNVTTQDTDRGVFGR